MRLAATLFACIAGAAGPAGAFTLGGLGEADLTVRLVPAAGSAPVGEAFVVAREWVAIPQFHGAKTYCFRGDIERGSREPRVLRLPEVGLGDLGLVERRYRALEAFVYSPGQCFERTPPASVAADNARFPGGGAGFGSRPAVVEGSQTILRSKGAQLPEERLLYLLDFAVGLYCGDPHWSERSAANLARLSEAMLAEAGTLARDRYEHGLVEELGKRLALAGAMRTKAAEEPVAPLALSAPAGFFARDFLLAPADARVSWQPRPPAAGPGATLDAPSIAIVAMPGAAQAVAMPPGGARGYPGAVARRAPDPAATRRVIHCRLGPASACDLDERDAQGSTALAGAAATLDAEAVQLLLEAGANPCAQVNVTGSAAAEALVARIITRPPPAGSAEERQARAIMGLIAASPKAALLQSVHDDLSADPATWIVSPLSRPLLLEAREAWRNLPVRADPRPACERIEISSPSALAPRLRVRRPGGA